jgi:hypothetical protein
MAGAPCANFSLREAPAGYLLHPQDVVIVRVVPNAGKEALLPPPGATAAPQ